MLQVVDKQTKNTLTVTPEWFAKHRALVTVPKTTARKDGKRPQVASVAP